MKCIKNQADEIKRINDEEAHVQVKSGNYTYCKKSEWKNTTRPQSKKTEKPKSKNEGKESKR